MNGAAPIHPNLYSITQPSKPYWCDTRPLLRDNHYPFVEKKGTIDPDDIHYVNLLWQGWKHVNKGIWFSQTRKTTQNRAARAPLIKLTLKRSRGGGRCWHAMKSPLIGECGCGKKAEKTLCLQDRTQRVSMTGQEGEDQFDAGILGRYWWNIYIPLTNTPTHPPTLQTWRLLKDLYTTFDIRVKAIKFEWEIQAYTEV